MSSFWSIYRVLRQRKHELIDRFTLYYFYCPDTIAENLPFLSMFNIIFAFPILGMTPFFPLLINFLP
jgi:hypothetical protein